VALYHKTDSIASFYTLAEPNWCSLWLFTFTIIVKATKSKAILVIQRWLMINICNTVFSKRLILLYLARESPGGLELGPLSTITPT
jgi:hypothetical protein